MNLKIVMLVLFVWPWMSMGQSTWRSDGGPRFNPNPVLPKPSTSLIRPSFERSVPAFNAARTENENTQKSMQGWSPYPRDLGETANENYVPLISPICSGLPVTYFDSLCNGASGAIGGGEVVELAGKMNPWSSIKTGSDIQAYCKQCSGKLNKTFANNLSGSGNTDAYMAGRLDIYVDEVAKRKIALAASELAKLYERMSILKRVELSSANECNPFFLERDISAIMKKTPDCVAEDSKNSLRLTRVFGRMVGGVTSVDEFNLTKALVGLNNQMRSTPGGALQCGGKGGVNSFFTAGDFYKTLLSDNTSDKLYELSDYIRKDNRFNEKLKACSTPPNVKPKKEITPSDKDWGVRLIERNESQKKWRECLSASIKEYYKKFDISEGTKRYDWEKDFLNDPFIRIFLESPESFNKISDLKLRPVTMEMALNKSNKSPAELRRERNTLIRNNRELYLGLSDPEIQMGCDRFAANVAEALCINKKTIKQFVSKDQLTKDFQETIATEKRDQQEASLPLTLGAACIALKDMPENSKPTRSFSVDSSFDPKNLADAAIENEWLAVPADANKEKSNLAEFKRQKCAVKPNFASNGYSGIRPRFDNGNVERDENEELFSNPTSTPPPTNEVGKTKESQEDKGFNDKPVEKVVEKPVETQSRPVEASQEQSQVGDVRESTGAVDTSINPTIDGSTVIPGTPSQVGVTTSSSGVTNPTSSASTPQVTKNDSTEVRIDDVTKNENFSRQSKEDQARLLEYQREIERLQADVESSNQRLNQLTEEQSKFIPKENRSISSEDQDNNSTNVPVIGSRKVEQTPTNVANVPTADVSNGSVSQNVSSNSNNTNMRQQNISPTNSRTLLAVNSRNISDERRVIETQKAAEALQYLRTSQNGESEVVDEKMAFLIIQQLQMNPNDTVVTYLENEEGMFLVKIKGTDKTLKVSLKNLQNLSSDLLDPDTRNRLIADMKVKAQQDKINSKKTQVNELYARMVRILNGSGLQ